MNSHNSYNNTTILSIVLFVFFRWGVARVAERSVQLRNFTMGAQEVWYPFCFRQSQIDSLVDERPVMNQIYVDKHVYVYLYIMYK